MLIELVVFGATVLLILLSHGNLSEWWHNTRMNGTENWRNRWHKIPYVKVVFTLFVVVLSFGFSLFFIRFPIEVFIWDLFFALRWAVFFLAGLLFACFLLCLGGRPARRGAEAGKLAPVVKDVARKRRDMPTFGDAFLDEVEGFADSVIYSDKKERKKKRKR